MPAPVRSIGVMRHLVTAQVATTTTDALGGQTETWADSFDFWGNVQPLTGQERLQAGEKVGTQPYTVETRYRTDLTRKNRLVWGAHTLEVLSAVNVGGRGQWLTLDCAEVTT